MAPLACFAFPLRQLTNMLDAETHLLVTPEAAEAFQYQTSMLFDPLEDPLTKTALPIACPFCHAQNSVPWVKVAGNWSCNCVGCARHFDLRHKLGHRWASDVEKWASGGTDVDGFRMSGGVLSQSNSRLFTKDPFAPVLSRMFSNKRETTLSNLNEHGQLIREHDKDLYGSIDCAGMEPVCFAAEFGFDIEAIATATLQWLDSYKHLSKDLRVDMHKRIHALFYPYRSAGATSHASLDLAAAVQRQYRFVDDAAALGWLDNHASVQLANAHARFRSWLALYAYCRTLLIPTLDIDLMWHTYMLSPFYYWDCYRSIGVMPDHNDRIEEHLLNKAFSLTQQQWDQAFGQPYVGDPKSGPSLRDFLPPLPHWAQKNKDSMRLTTYAPSYTRAVTVAPESEWPADAEKQTRYAVGYDASSPGKCIASPANQPAPFMGDMALPLVEGEGNHMLTIGNLTIMSAF